jgi:hypothetical protein
MLRENGCDERIRVLETEREYMFRPIVAGVALWAQARPLLLSWVANASVAGLMRSRARHVEKSANVGQPWPFRHRRQGPKFEGVFLNLMFLARSVGTRIRSRRATRHANCDSTWPRLDFDPKAMVSWDALARLTPNSFKHFRTRSFH